MSLNLYLKPWSCSLGQSIRSTNNIHNIYQMRNIFLSGKSLMVEWLELASQWHGMYCHDLEVMSSNPERVELGVHSTSVLSHTSTQKNQTRVFLSRCINFVLLWDIVYEPNALSVGLSTSQNDLISWNNEHVVWASGSFGFSYNHFYCYCCKKHSLSLSECHSHCLQQKQKQHKISTPEHLKTNLYFHVIYILQ